MAQPLISRGSTRFWKLYQGLPLPIQKLAQKNYHLWKRDSHHASLAFKKLKGGAGNRFSIRVGDHYRAIGHRVGNDLEWVWIGSHEEYNQLI